MDFEDVPCVTAVTAGWMGVIHLVEPTLTPLTYSLLAPWMHSGWPHLWQNLVIFGLLGVWIEQRVGWLTFLLFVALIPYLALYVPVVFDYGGLSNGASGLTKALTGYVIPALFVALYDLFDYLESDWRELTIAGVMLLAALYLTVDAWQTIWRFAGIKPRPDGVAVSAHLTGLVLGVLWFGWRSWRHGILEA